MARPRQKVLVVDDEPRITDVVGSYLDKAGFEPLAAGTGTEALALFEKSAPALVILDLMLPDIPGEEVCRRLRSRSRVPIIMLTAKAGENDSVRGLSLGADDYVTKPFSPRELMARVDAVLRRSEGETAILAERLSFCGNDLAIDPRTNVVQKNGVPITLTPRELRLLRLFAGNPGRVFSREELIERALGEDFAGSDRTVDAHVKNLRHKIETDPGDPRYVRTVHGMGYRFCTEADE